MRMKIPTDPALFVESGIPHQPSPIHHDPLNFASYYDNEDYNYREYMPLVYAGLEPEIDPKCPTICLWIGPSGAGKDSTIYNLDANRIPIHHVVTATSRFRRFEHKKHEHRKDDETRAWIEQTVRAANTRQERDAILDMLHASGYLDAESINSYVWMRLQDETETFEEYCANLVTEYDLVESDGHNNAFYGLPRANLEAARAVQGKKLPVLRTEISGAKTVIPVLRALGYNTVTLAILPDSFDQADSVIEEREDNPATILKRKTDNRKHVAQYPEVVNFYIRNTRIPKGQKTGAEQTNQDIRELLMYLGIYVHPAYEEYDY